MSDDYVAVNVPGRWAMEKDAEITRLRAELAAEKEQGWKAHAANLSLAEDNDDLRAENKRLREALKETLAIASRNEAGDYIDHARAALEGVTEKSGAVNE